MKKKLTMTDIINKFNRFIQDAQSGYEINFGILLTQIKVNIFDENNAQEMVKAHGVNSMEDLLVFLKEENKLTDDVGDEIRLILNKLENLGVVNKTSLVSVRKQLTQEATSSSGTLFGTISSSGKAREMEMSVLRTTNPPSVAGTEKSV